jgi:hypothetical protein
VRRDAGTSTHPYLRATSRAPCYGGRRSRSPEPTMPYSRASNSRRPDLVVSLEYLTQDFESAPPGTVRKLAPPRKVNRNRRGTANPSPGCAHVVQCLGADFLEAVLMLEQPVVRSIGLEGLRPDAAKEGVSIPSPTAACNHDSSPCGRALTELGVWISYR